MNIETFFDNETFTLTYIVWDPSSKDALVIDSVLNFNNASGTYSYESINKIDNFINRNELTLHYIIETHAHADHLTGAQELKNRYPSAQITIGKEITKVQETFKNLFNLKNDFSTDGSQFDKLIGDGETFNAGTIIIQAIHTPGHTESCYSFKIEDNVFVGDALFMSDFGVGRCDFPQGSAENLFTSISKKLYSLPDQTVIYTGHDYMPNGRDLKYKTTIKEEKENNIQLKGSTTKEDFIKFRTERDKTLSTPKLLLPSIQVNIDAGKIPLAENNDISYLKLPIQLKNN